jgi:hypothetical protein
MLTAIKKINLKKYLGLGLVNFAIFAAFCRSSVEVYVLLGVAFATFINHVLLVTSISEVVDAQKNDTSVKKPFNVFFPFAAKIIVLFLTFSVGYQFIGPRIIISIILYVVQIFILALSMHRKSV